MGSMFYECNNITQIDLSNINFANVSDFSFMFYNNTSLTEIKYPTDFTTENAKKFYNLG